MAAAGVQRAPTSQGQAMRWRGVPGYRSQRLSSHLRACAVSVSASMRLTAPLLRQSQAAYIKAALARVMAREVQPGWSRTRERHLRR